MLQSPLPVVLRREGVQAGHVRTTAVGVADFFDGASERQVPKWAGRSLREAPPAAIGQERWSALAAGRHSADPQFRPSVSDVDPFFNVGWLALHYLDVPDQTCLLRIEKRNVERPEGSRHLTEENFARISSYFEAPEPSEGSAGGACGRAFQRCPRAMSESQPLPMRSDAFELEWPMRAGCAVPTAARATLNDAPAD